MLARVRYRPGVSAQGKRSNWLALSLLAAVASAGCVAQKDYDALRRQLDDSQAKLADSEQAAEALAATLRTKLDEATERDAQLRSEIDVLKQQVAAAEVEQIEREGQLASLIKDRGELEESITEMQDALAELRRRRAATERRIAAYRDLLDRFQSLIDAGQLKVKIVDGRMVVEMQTDVLFASGSASLSATGEQAISDVTAILAAIPKRRYQVEGHTDNVPISTQRYPSNWELASARALGVVQAMVAAGLAADRVSAASYSQYRPAAPNDTAANKAENRRIEIVVVPDLEDLPGADELNQLAN